MKYKYSISVMFSDHSMAKCMYINDSRKFWRQISKICKRWNVRVIDVVKEAY